MPRLVPVAWIAGFSEGEGTFTNHSHWNNTTRKGERMYYRTFVPTYQVSQKERQPLDLIKKFWDFHGVRGRVWARNNIHGGAFEYRTLGLKNAEIVFKVLLPHMHSLRKRKQATNWIKSARVATNHPTDTNIFGVWEKKAEVLKI